MSKNLYGVTNKMVVTLGGRRTKAKAMKAVEIEEEIRSQQKSEGIRRAAMSAKQRAAEQARYDIPDPEPMDTYEDEVLTGATRIDISAGGEATLGAGEGSLGADATEMYEELAANHNRTQTRRKRPDVRKRYNRTKLIYDSFAPQMEAIGHNYMGWELFERNHGPTAAYVLPEGVTPLAMRQIWVVDVFEAKYRDISILATDTYLSDALIRQGLFPCSPYFPSVAFTTAALKLFQALHLRSPRLGKQGYIRAINDLRGTAPGDYEQKQFTVAFDLYLRTKELVRIRVKTRLGRNGPLWRLQNALHKVKGEEVLDPPFMVTMDGNNSLKRFQRRERLHRPDGTVIPGSSVESLDDRPAPGDYYLSEEYVNQFAKYHLGKQKESAEKPKVGCGDGWKNAQEKYTSKSWGMYRETGWFGVLCRHGIVFKICDMVESGEGAQYPLATIAHLLEVLGTCLVGYDIGCQFHEWAQKHPKLSGPYLKELCRAIVGAFHGASHHRLCQLLNLPLYNKGLGLEAREICEVFFSKSNALAGVTRTASRFHRQQEIVEYVAHANTKDAYANISSLLTSKYKQAVEILESLPALEEAMKALGVDDRSVFETWYEEQKERLERVAQDVPEETLQLEYYQKLVNLAAHEERVAAFIATDADIYTMSAEELKIEITRRHAVEKRDKTLRQVQELESRLGIRARWTPESEEWKSASVLSNERKYRLALDKVQALVIARLLELGKVNLAGTSYKMCQLIAKALQSRSKALRKAVEAYNIIVQVLDRELLEWAQVVDYAFLADFDLLRLSEEDYRNAGWARAGAREAMDHHFRLLQAEEERTRLNVEIKRLATYMKEEEEFLLHHERLLEEEGDFALAEQVRRYRMEEGRFNDIHRARLQRLSKIRGFTGDITLGEGVSDERRVPSAAPVQTPEGPGAPPMSLVTPDAQPEEGRLTAVELEVLAEAGGYEGDNESDDEDGALGEAFEKVLDLTGDGEDTAAADRDA